MNTRQRQRYCPGRPSAAATCSINTSVPADELSVCVCVSALTETEDPSFVFRREGQKIQIWTFTFEFYCFSLFLVVVFVFVSERTGVCMWKTIFKEPPHLLTSLCSSPLSAGVSLDHWCTTDSTRNDRFCCDNVTIIIIIILLNGAITSIIFCNDF